jgi:hypothetical protein
MTSLRDTSAAFAVDVAGFAAAIVSDREVESHCARALGHAAALASINATAANPSIRGVIVMFHAHNESMRHPEVHDE